MNPIALFALIVGILYVLIFIALRFIKHLSGFQVEEKALQAFGSEIRDTRPAKGRRN